MPDVTIRPATEADRDAVWDIFHAVVARGDAFVFEPGISREVALEYWYGAPHVYVAIADENVAGSYILKPNQPGLGSHVANASYMVPANARGLGVGRAMGEHSLAEARRLGFLSMQFNIVVSTNESAVRLWKSLGFEIVGTTPKAFRHASLGFVDAHIMYREL